MNPNEDEGQEVRLIPGGVSVINSRREMDLVGLDAWIKSLESDMSRILEEHNAAESISLVVDAFTERYLDDQAIPGYTIIKAGILTQLTIGALQFDAKVEIIPRVLHMIAAVGFCPVLHLYHSNDYDIWVDSATENPPKSQYLGRIKVVDFNELFYQPI